MRRLLVATLLAGCEPGGARIRTDGSGSSGTGTGTATGAATGTGTGSTTPSTVEAICDATANPLRFLCDVAVDPPQPVDVTFWIAGTATEYTLSSEAIEGDHEVLLYILKADTRYDWRATARNDPSAVVAGSFTTGSLTGGCAVDATVVGTSSAPYIVTQSPCIEGGHMIVVDADGDVVWCDDLAVTGMDPMMEGSDFTEDGTFIAVLGDAVVEVDIAGNHVLELVRGVDFDHHVHHDVFRKSGYTYVLFNETVLWNATDYDLDGFYVFDSAGALVAEWHLFDHFQPANLPIGWPGRDYSHANAVWVDDNLDLLISFRHLSAAASVRADPTDPSFGTINWRIAGEGDRAEFGSDYELVSALPVATNFERQHNVHFLPNGELAMFDNRDTMNEYSRLVQFALDPAVGQADLVAAYEVPMHCDFQGGAWHTSIGNPMATCAPVRRAWEWDVGASTPRWDMTLECSSGFESYIPRFIPWDGPF